MLIVYHRTYQHQRGCNHFLSSLRLARGILEEYPLNQELKQDGLNSRNERENAGNYIYSLLYEYRTYQYHHEK